MHGTNAEGAFHEPTVWCPGFSRSGPPEGGTPNKFRRTVRFKFPMHGTNAEGAFREPTQSRWRSRTVNSTVEAMDYPLLCFTFLLFLAAGYVGHREYRRLAARWPDASLTNFHVKPGWVRFVLLILVILLGPSLYLVIHRPSLWLLPAWLELSLLWWSNGLAAALFGLLLGLAWGAMNRETLPNARALVLTAILCQAALLVMTAWMQRIVADQLGDSKWSGQMLLQTSGFSCAPASASRFTVGSENLRPVMPAWRKPRMMKPGEVPAARVLMKRAMSRSE